MPTKNIFDCTYILWNEIQKGQINRATHTALYKQHIKIIAALFQEKAFDVKAKINISALHWNMNAFES